MKADTVLIGAKESWLLILFNCLPPIFLLNTSSISPTLSLTRCIISQTQKQATHMQPEKILISRENRHQPPRAASFFAAAPQLFMTVMLVLYQAIIAFQVAPAEAKGRSGR